MSKEFFNYSIFAILGCSILFIPKLIIPDYLLLMKVLCTGTVLMLSIRMLIKKEVIIIDNYGIIFFLFVLFHFLSFFWSNYPYAIWTRSFNFLLLFLIYIIVRNNKFPTSLLKVKRYIFAIVLINISILSIYLFYIGLLDSDGFSFAEFKSLKNIFPVNSNYTSSILVFQLIGLKFLIDKNILPRANKVLFAISVLLILLLNSKASTIAMIFVLVAMALNSKKTNWIDQLKMGSAVIVISVLLISTMSDRLNFIKAYNPIRSISGESNDDRLKLWEMSFNLFKEKPVLGHGIDSWSIAHLKYGVDQFSNSFDTELYYYHAHNIFIEYLAELGIIGFTLLLMLFVYPFIFSLKDKKQYLFYGLIITFICNSFYSIHYSVVFQPLLALFFSLVALQIKHRPRIKSKTATLFIFFLGILCMLYFIGYIRFEKELFQDWKSLKKSSNELVNDLDRLNSSKFFKYINYTPTSEEISKIYWSLNKKSKSINSLKQALKENPYRWTNHYRMGQRYLSINKPKLAYSFFESCLQHNPSYFKARLAMLRLDLKNKNWNEFDKNISFFKIQVEEVLDKYYEDAYLLSSIKKQKKFYTNFCAYYDKTLALIDKKQKLQYKE